MLGSELLVIAVELLAKVELVGEGVEVVEDGVGVLEVVEVVEVVEVEVDVGVVLVGVGFVLVELGVGVCEGVEVGLGVDVGVGVADDVVFGLSSLPDDPSRLKTTMLAEPPWGTVATQNAEPPAPSALSLLVTPLPSTRQGNPVQSPLLHLISMPKVGFLPASEEAS